MPEYRVLRVFCADDGSGGNELAVFLDGAAVPPSERQEAARRIGFSETVFVDDRAGGVVQIFTPTVEMPFAGHPLVGTAWLLANTGELPGIVRPPAGDVPARTEGDRAWVAGRPSGRPRSSSSSWARRPVEALGGPPGGHDLIGAWAWEDEATGAYASGCSRCGWASPRRGHRRGRGGPLRPAGPRGDHPPGTRLGDRGAAR